MGYCCADCGDANHTCTAWDGKGNPDEYTNPDNNSIKYGIPNHNLVEKCPSDIRSCDYRKEKIPSPF